MILLGLISPLLTVPAAIACAAGVSFYWFRLGHETVPESTRRLRRASILAIVVSLGVLVLGLSFVDGDVEPRRFAIVWTLFLALLWLVVMFALIDAMNTMRIHRRARQALSHDAAKGLGEALRQSNQGSGDRQA